MVVPFMYLFAGLGIQTLIELARGSTWRRAVSAGVIIVTVGVAAFNVDRYFDWIGSKEALTARGPAVASSDFPLWSGLARDYAKTGRVLSHEEWLRYLAQQRQ